MLDLTTLQPDERQLLTQCVATLLNKIVNNVERPVQDVASVSPTSLANLIRTLRDLVDIIAKSGMKAVEPAGLAKPDISFLLPFVKLAVIQHRREQAPYLQEKANQILDPALRAEVERPLTLLSRLMQHLWFKKTTAARLPKATDYITIRQAEQKLNLPRFGERTYDEKFGILLAANLFSPDLRYLRAVCEMRGTPLCIAYIDIDDFKAYNTKYGEPTVDRDILPRLMSALEAHFFFRGYAYRIGGDEYVVLLPNLSRGDAASLFASLRSRLQSVDYPLISDTEPKPTVSVGICELNAESVLTEFEGEERAAYAKQYAKENGKNCIASYRVDSDYTNNDLEILRRD